MDNDGFDRASRFWDEKGAVSRRMTQSDIEEAFEAFAVSHNVCAMATASGDLVRCTPLEYTFVDGKFYIVSEGGLKFRAMRDNKNVCLAIFETEKGFDNLESMQVTGLADIVEPFSDEYDRVMDIKKIPLDALKGIDHTMYMIRVTPGSVDMLCSEFKKDGYDSRQHLDL